MLTTDARWEAPLIQLQGAGARVVELGNSARTIYIHAKVIAADVGTPSARLLPGSQNFSIASLRYNRELGVMTSDAALVSAAAAVIKSDAKD